MVGRLPGRGSLTAIDWNQWRANYDDMTFADHQAFNAAVLERHPVQQQWNHDACARFIAERQPRTIVEVGGWDGSLADAMLGMYAGIDTWVNYDITPGVPQVCSYPGYERIVLNVWPWLFKVTADALVASHVFEHMRVSEVLALLDRWDVRSVYVDTPLSGAPMWDGYEGSHIIEVGAAEFLERVSAAGWTVSHSEPGLIAFLDRSGS